MYIQLCNMNTWGHIGQGIFATSFPCNRWSLHCSVPVWCRIRRHDCPVSASLQWLPEMLLVSLLPHYIPLCVLCEWLMMIMQMCHQRAAWVIITGENEAFWNSLTAEEKTMGLQCVCESVYLSVYSTGKLGDLLLWPWRWLPNLYALWYFYPS